MPDKNPFDDLRRAKEEEYFRRKEQELVEKMRHRAKSEVERLQMSAASGVTDEDILQDLQDLGFDRETVLLLHLVPLVHVAWVDGHVSKRERERLFEAARLRGVKEGSPAHRQLSDWLDHRPPEEFFRKTLRVIRDILQALPAEEQHSRKQDLVTYSTQIAKASGGILGLGSKISDAEQILIEQIAKELEHDHTSAAKQVVEEI
jgi:prepilin-type processing-associated H-X9-DG protein